METIPQNDQNTKYSKTRSFFESPYPASVKICTSGVSEYGYLTNTEMESWVGDTKRYSDHAPIQFSINSDTDAATKQHGCSTGSKSGGGEGGGAGGGGNDIKLISWNIAQMCNCPITQSHCNHKFKCDDQTNKKTKCIEDESSYIKRLSNIATAIKTMMTSNDYALIQEGPDRTPDMVTQFKTAITSAGLKMIESTVIKDGTTYNNQFYLIHNVATDTYVNAGAILLGKQGLKFSGFAENLLKAVKARLLTTTTYTENDINYDFSRVWFFINTTKSKEKILIPVHFGFQEVKMWKRQQKLYMFMNAIVHTFRTSADSDIAPYRNYDIVFSGDFNMNLIQKLPKTPTPIKATFLQCSDVPGQETIIYTNQDNAPSSFGGKNKGEYNPTNIDFAVYYPKVTMAASPVAVKVKPIVAPIPISKPISPVLIKSTGSADNPFKPEDYGYYATTPYQVYSIMGTNVRLVALNSGVQKASTDAIVNAANDGCIGGGGIDEIIGDLGGTILDTKRRALPLIISKNVRCPTGTATPTSVTDDERNSSTPNPYKLKSNTVIHAVGPDYNITDFTDADKSLKSAYTSTIQVANNLKIRSIAFCLLSASIFAGKRNRDGIIKLGIDAIIEETIRLQKSIKLHTIIVCGYIDKDKGVIKVDKNDNLKDEYTPLLTIMDDLVKSGTLTKGEPVKSSYKPTCTHPFCIAHPGVEAVHAIIVVRKDEKDCIILGKAKGDVATPANDKSKEGKYDLIGGNTDGKCIFQTLQEESIEESRLVSIDEKKGINIFFKKGTTDFHVEPWKNVSNGAIENKFIFVGEIDLRTASANEYYYRDATNMPLGIDVKWDGDVAVLTKTIQYISKSSDPKVTGPYKDNTEITCQNPNSLISPTYGYAAKHIKQFKDTEYYRTLKFA
jgi:O-acetyl-ADP-ribose deacetylase (regulator of RNase III)